MWYPSTVIVAPSVEPVSLVQAKANLRVDHDSDDTLIGDMIAQAREHIESRCHAVLAEQTILSACDSFSDLARLPHGPLKSVTSIAYVDAAGEEETIPEDVYQPMKDGLEPSIALKAGRCWPRNLPGSRISVTAIYGGNTPRDIERAILLLVGAWYENREATVIGVSVGALPVGVNLDSLVCNHRRGV